MLRVAKALAKAVKGRAGLVRRKVPVRLPSGRMGMAFRWVRPTREEQEAKRTRAIHTLVFKRWFGDWENDPANASKVVDERGQPDETYSFQPIKVYHGTRSQFREFDPERVRQSQRKAFRGPGFYFADDKSAALWYAKHWAVGELVQPDDFEERLREEAEITKQVWEGSGADAFVYAADQVVRALDGAPGDLGKLLEHVGDKHEYTRLIHRAGGTYSTSQEIMECYLNIRKPFHIDLDTLNGKTWGDLAQLGHEAAYAVLQTAGYDGLVSNQTIEGEVHKEWVAFRPEQIKAVENEGTFDPMSPDIYKALAKAVKPTEPETERVGFGLTDDEKEFLAWLAGVRQDPKAMGQEQSDVMKALAKAQPPKPPKAKKGEGEAKGAKKPKADEDAEGGKGKRPSAKPHFTPEEMKAMGLRWVTAHPHGEGTVGVPIIVKDLGDDEGMVVGGAGGELNYTRFKFGEKGTKPKRPDKPKVSEDLTEEEASEITEKKSEKAKAREAIEQQMYDYVRERFGTGLSKEQEADIERRVGKKATELGVSEKEAREELTKEAEKTGEQIGEEQAKAAAKAAAEEAMRALGREQATGQEQEGDVEYEHEGETKRIALNKEDYEKLAGLEFERRDVRREERALARALKKGDVESARAVKLHVTADPETIAAYAEEEHYERAKVEHNNALVDITEGEAKTPSAKTAAHDGAADTAMGIASELTNHAVLDTETANAIGIAGTARVLAHHLAEKLGGEDGAAKAIRRYIGTHSAATAAKAVERAEELFGNAEAMKDFGPKGDGTLGVAAMLYQRQKYAKQARLVAHRALGSLEAAAQAALILEQKQGGPLVVGGTATRVGTVNKAAELGLNAEDYVVRKAKGAGYEIRVQEGSIGKLADARSLEQYEMDEEIAKIKRYGASEPDDVEEWRGKGQSENAILRPHQAADIQFWEKQKGILVGDEAGSGKTAVALCGLAHLHEQGKVNKALLVVPKSVLQQFGSEVEQFLEAKYHKRVQVISGSIDAKKRAQMYANDSLMTVITHDTVRHDFTHIQGAKFDAIAVDEAHMFKVRGEAKGSRRANLLRQLQPEYRMAMSGTLVPNDLSELHSIADWAQPGALGDRKEFLKRYAQLGRTEGLMDNALVKALGKELEGVLIGMKLTKTVTKDGQERLALKSSPKPDEPVTLKEEVVRTKMSPTQRAAYRENEAAYRQRREEGRLKGAVFTRDQRNKKAAENTDDNAKIAEMSERVAAHPDEKHVFFARHKWATNSAIKQMGLKKGEYEILDGSTSDKRRKALSDRINDPKDPLKKLFCSDAANFGINLYGASVMHMLDVHEVPAVVRQRIGREFRRNQQRDVSVYHYQVDSPIERSRAELQKTKTGSMEVVDQVMSVDESGVGETLLQYLEEAKA